MGERYLSDKTLARADQRLARHAAGLNDLVASMHLALDEFDPTDAWAMMVAGAGPVPESMTKSALIELVSAAVLRIVQTERGERG